MILDFLINQSQQGKQLLSLEIQFICFFQNCGGARPSGICSPFVEALFSAELCANTDANHTYTKFSQLLNRPGVAGAVLQNIDQKY